MEPVPESVAELLKAIETREPEMMEQRLRAMSLLGDLLLREPHEDGVTGLLNCVRQDRSIRCITHAVSILGRIKALEGVPVLIDVLLATHIDVYDHPPTAQFIQTDESLRLRCNAAMALGKIRDERAIVPLMSILNDRAENYRLRLAAAETLGRIGDEYVVKPLIDILIDEREKSLYLKESVVKALGLLGDIRAIEPLIDMLESKRGIRDKFNFLKEQIIESVRRIGRSNRKATDSLLLALDDDAPSIRLAAIEALSTIGDESCLEPLQAHVFDADDDVSRAAVYAVYALGGETAVRALLQRENLPQFLRDELEGYIP